MKIEKIADFSKLAGPTRRIFYNENHKLYYDFSKAVEKLPLEYTNKEIEDAVKKLKQLILMRQFLKPYRDKFIFSDINFLTTANEELDRYRRIILDNINGLTEQSLIDLETKLGIKNFNKTYTQKQDRRFSRNSPRSLGSEAVRSPGPSSKNNSVNSASIETSAGISPNYNNNYILVSPNLSSGSKKRKKHKKRKYTKTRGRKKKETTKKSSSNTSSSNRNRNINNFNTRLASPQGESPTSLGNKKQQAKKSSRKRKSAKKNR